MIGGGLEHIDVTGGAFGGEIASLPAARIHADHGFRRLKRRQKPHQIFCQRRFPFCVIQIQRRRFQRLVGRGLDCFAIRLLAAELFAGFKAIGDDF